MSPAGPEDVTTSYVWAILLDDFEQAAAAILESELELFQEQILGAARQLLPEVLVTEVLPVFHDAESLADLADLSPQAFFASFLGGVMRRMRMDDDDIAIRGVEVLQVDVDGDVATVECRSTYDSGTEGGEPLKATSRVGLRHVDGRWQILLDERIAGLKDQLLRRVEEAGGE